MSWHQMRRGVGSKPNLEEYQRKKAELSELKRQDSEGEIHSYYLDEVGFFLIPAVPYAYLCTTFVNDYVPYRVPEVWLFPKKQLLIYQLQGAEYSLQEKSLYFPEIQLKEAIARCLQIAYESNTSSPQFVTLSND